MLHKIFTDNKDNYILKNKDLNCDNCNKDLADFAIVKTYFYKQKGKPAYKNFIFCCNTCGKKHRFIQAHSKVMLCYVVEKIKSNYIAVFPEMQFKDSSRVESVFSAVNIPSGKTVDRTIHAGRISLEGASIGSATAIEDTVDKDNALEIKDADKLLLSLKNSKPVIESDEKAYITKK